MRSLYCFFYGKELLSEGNIVPLTDCTNFPYSNTMLPQERKEPSPDIHSYLQNIIVFRHCCNQLIVTINLCSMFLHIKFNAPEQRSLLGV